MKFFTLNKIKISKKQQVLNFFATKKWYLMAIAVLLPAILQQMLSASMNLIDNIMVGKLDSKFISDLGPMNRRIEDVFLAMKVWHNKSWWSQNGLIHFFNLHYTAGQLAVTGVTASNQIFVIIFAIIAGFINAVGVFGAQFYGAGRYGSLRQTVRVKIIFGFMVGILVIIFSYTIGYQLIAYTTSPNSAYKKFIDLAHESNLDTNKIATLTNYLDYNKEWNFEGFQKFANSNFSGNKKDLAILVLRYFDFRSASLATIQGMNYNKFVVLSYPLLGINFAFISVFRETKRGFIPLALTFIAVILNFTLNLLLINGIASIGIKGIGVAGSAIATLVSRIIQFLLICGIIFWKKYEFQPHVLKMFKIKKQLLKQILLTAWPLILNDLLFAIASTVIIRLISQWSFDALSGSAIAATINTMFYTLYTGFGIASSVLIASHLGSNDLEGAKYNAKHLLRSGFIVSLFFAGLLVLASFLIPPLLFKVTDEALRISEWMLRIDAMAFSTYTILYVCIYAFRAGGLSITVLLIESFFTWSITILVLFLQVKFASYDIIYIYGITRLTEIIKLAFALSIYSRKKWVRNLAGNKSVFSEDVIQVKPVVSHTAPAEPEANIANF